MTGSPGTRLAPDLPDGPRAALVIATSSYQDPELRQLRAPARDAEDLADVLADPRIGGFTVSRVVNADERQVRREIDLFLSGRGVDDVVVVYLSCHGVLDRRNRLYFAASDTLKTQLGSTGILAAWLLEQLEECRARRQVLILDCCFSGAFAHGTKGDTDLDLERRLVGQGRGRAVLTASRAGEYSFEGQALAGAAVAGSVFTTGLVTGLRTGAADVGGDGYVSLDEAYDYAYGYVQSSGASQTPQRWLYGGEGAILLARSPAGIVITPAPVPEALAAGLDSPYPEVRIGAVRTLGEWLTGADPARALTAEQKLRQIADSDVPAVAAAANACFPSPERAAPARRTSQQSAEAEPLPPPDRHAPRDTGGLPAAQAPTTTLTVSFTITLRLRSWRIRREYLRRARTESRELVPTAGAMIDRVVGRDDLCQVVMADLNERQARPHVLVGGVGAGKTAVLVRLTELLADKRVVPVPVRLRDAADALDFESLAQERFLSEVNQRLISSLEGEIIWRRLRKRRKIVVLADGLEQALVGGTAERERDSTIHTAIRRAHQQALPLVITSRPHDPLRRMEATILVLEPVSYDAALAYIAGYGPGEDERRLAWIVETADVVEAPLYLQITRELQLKGLLDQRQAVDTHGVGRSQPRLVDTHGVDRSQLRLALLETWHRALITGHLREDVPLNQAERLAAVEYLSALACVGLGQDRLEVELDELAREARISAAVQARLAKIDGGTPHATGVQNTDVRLAAAWAAQLGLAELRGNSVRFPHSLIQAYLGSRLLDVALQDPAYRQRALRLPGPGRELLTAMVLHSRAPDATGTRRPDPARRQATVSAPNADTPAAKRRDSRRTSTPASDDAWLGYVDLLRQAAAKRDDNKVLDMYAAALEIDCGTPEPAHRAIASEISARWPRIHARDPRTLEVGKLALVRRFGEAARRIDDRRQQGEQSVDLPAYRQLYEIACLDRSYPVRLAAAQEAAEGGDTAYRELSEVLAAPCPYCGNERGGRLERAGRLLPESAADSPAAKIISAWLAPMLAGSVGATGSGQSGDLAAQARADLDQWLRHIGRAGRRSGEEDLDLTLEIAVAQGFKHAANRQPAHAYTRHETRMHLAERALEMLKGARYWFSQLTLIQALCLLSLSDQPKQHADRYGATPEAIVQHWLDVAGSESTDRNQSARAPAEPHPFVREAAQLAVLALKTGQPQRYLWIDESGVVGQVGSRMAGGGTTYRPHRQWIPRSAGWTALDGRAQQLVADVLLLLNLADRGDQPPDSERRLKRSNRSDLPPCITHYRPALDPGLTVGTATSAAPGTNCVDGCAFDLCPYPPKGAQPRVEMSEAFCRRQQTLLTGRSLNPRKAPWQQMRRRELVQFWADMAHRA